MLQGHTIRDTSRSNGASRCFQKHANQIVTQLAQRSHYEDLLEGVEIHLYEPCFLHAKHMTVDGDIALLGSTNMDIRSFALNAEINLVVYDPRWCSQLKDINVISCSSLNHGGDVDRWGKGVAEQRPTDGFLL